MHAVDATRTLGWKTESNLMVCEEGSTADFVVSSRRNTRVDADFRLKPALGVLPAALRSGDGSSAFRSLLSHPQSLRRQRTAVGEVDWCGLPVLAMQIAKRKSHSFLSVI